MSQLGYMAGAGEEQPRTPEQNNELFGKIAEVGNK